MYNLRYHFTTSENDMLINYDIPKINKVLDDFYNATGIRIDLFSDDFTPISYSGHEICNYCNLIQQNKSCKDSCMLFDKKLLEKSQKSQKTERDICPYGLLNIVSPIIYNSEAIGYLFFGQMKTNESFDNLKEYEKEYTSLPLYSISQAKSISSLAKILIGHILTENMLKPDTAEALTKAVTYINENLDKDLSIKQISRNTNISKSVLYSKFHSRFNCTIGEYINKKRIDMSVDLLLKTSLSIEEISQKCGFSSASYFTKTFKQQMGITPLKFKKAQA